MAKDKKGFVLYADLIHTVKKLPQEQQAKLFIHILEYVNDLNPETDDILVDIAFESIKQHLKRDLKKYEKRAENSRKNGLKGGRPITQKTQSVKKEPRKPDTVTVIDKVKDSINIPPYIDFLKYAVEKKPKLNPDTLKLKYDSWIENDWKDGNDNPIKNWKTKILNTLPYIDETSKRVNTNPTVNTIFTDGE